MKKVIGILTTSLLLLTITLAGCEDAKNSPKKVKNQENNESEGSSFEEVISLIDSTEPETEGGKTYKKQTKAVFTALSDAFTVLENYDIELEEQTRGSSECDDELECFFASLPEDISKVKRMRTRMTRSGEVEEEVTLEDEMNEVMDKYEETLKEIKPDTTDAESLDCIERDGDLLVYDGDMVFDPKTLGGMVAAEIFNAYARGEDTDKVVEDIEKTAGVIFEDADDEDEEEFTEEEEITPEDDEESEEEINEVLTHSGQTRGHYIRDTSFWPNGRVYYRWGDIRDSYKNEMINAMDDWKNKSGGKVKFLKMSYSAINRFLCLIGQKSYVNISERNLGSNTNGRATVGKAYGHGHLYLHTTLNSTQLKRTTRHELGHTLGLKHEHQRWDRDEYIYASDLGPSSSNTKKLDRTHKYYTWVKKTKKVKTFWKTYHIKYWVYVKRNKTYSYTPTTYDYWSIMHYRARVKKTRQGKSAGQWIDAPNIISISSRDADTIKKKY